MKNSDYWKQRFVQLEKSQTAQSAKTSAAVQAAYKNARVDIENQIFSWYGRLATNNGVSIAQARQLLKADELEEFHWSVDEYIKRGKECGSQNQKWFKELENASAKFHITRLQALETNLKANFEILSAQKDGLVADCVKDAYKTGYYKSCFEVQRGFNIGFDIGQIDEKMIDRLIRKPWAADGYNFSERIWRDKNKLLNLAHQEMMRTCMLGSNPQKAIKTLAKAMETSEFNARRLVMTESSYFHALGERDMYKEFGFEKYEVIATHSASVKTCELCAEMDGKVFLTKDFEPGLNANPFHPNCHCTTVPYFDDFNEGEMQFARDADGSSYYIPSDMPYKDWKRRFVDGDKTGFEAMSASQNNWAGAEPVLHTAQELEELHNFARANQIHLVEPTKFDGDIQLCKEQITIIRMLADELKIKGKISLGYSSMEVDDFGITSKHNKTIFINKLASRNRELTNSLLNADNFLSSTDAVGIGVHELGHIWVAQNGSKGIDIARKAYYNVYKKEISEQGILDYMAGSISTYCVQAKESATPQWIKQSDYPEVIPEILAANVTNPTEFTKEFVKLMKEM